MTILVTGSAGHLGEALMRTLRAAGRPARGIDLKPSAWTDRTGSISDPDFIRQCMDGVRTVIHAATLHKPHVATHTAQDFIDTNLTGTQVLLEAAVAAGVEAFVFTSTTSAFGAALTPAAGEPAAWVTEDVVPIPRNIYGVTKVAAEDLCQLVHRQHGLPVIVLRTSRFFPEADDNAAVRDSYATANAQANELLYRRVDIADVVGAHLVAIEKAPILGFRRYIISATTPFTRDHLPALRRDAASVVRRLFPDSDRLYATRGWTLLPSMDRVYVNERAVTDLGWRPTYDFAHVLASLRAGEDFRSPLAREIGSKGYHAETFVEGPYPVA
ncbi:NAD(P)-dependent oxidoreductase [Bradyrhizobium prioriisuperbiae]|uniref:NAD-dependent epimerase/dehydratase family protein n=1 Tax=Bradyrhizobium prioriisuperbiae TaxID=2854389 RepID=UPI0028E6BCF6|nr:NAD(P)-dependent oxidoreductase [Bradyrhizobium prioritasuperba]